MYKLWERLEARHEPPTAFELEIANGCRGPQDEEVQNYLRDLIVLKPEAHQTVSFFVSQWT